MLDLLVKTIFYCDNLTIILLDIQEQEGITTQFPLEKGNCFEALGSEVEILLVKDISIRLIKFEKGISIDIDEVKTKEKLSFGSDVEFLRLSIHKNRINIGK